MYAVCRLLYTGTCTYTVLCTSRVIILQTLADEGSLHLMPPLTAAVLPSRLYATNSVNSGHAVQHLQAQKHLQCVLWQLAQGDLLGKSCASNSLVAHLKP